MLAREAQQALGHDRALLQSGLCHAQNLLILFDNGATRLNHIDGSARGLQHIVQVVNDTGQQLTDCLALLRTLGYALSQTLRGACNIQLNLDAWRLRLCTYLVVRRRSSLLIVPGCSLAAGLQRLVERA